MGKKEEDFYKRLLETFRLEAGEHITAMSSGLIELEKAPSVEEQLEIIESVFREAHSLKGAARAVSLADIEAVCQSLENVFAALKRREITQSPGMLDTLHHVVDFVDRLLSSPKDNQSIEITEITQHLNKLVPGGEQEKAVPSEDSVSSLKQDTRIQYAEEEQKTREEVTITVDKTAELDEKAEAPNEKSPRRYQEERALPETVRISTKKIDNLFTQAEEMLTTRMAIEHHATDLQEINAMFTLWEKEWTKSTPEVRAIRRMLKKQINQEENGAQTSQLMKLLEFLDFNRDHIKSLEESLSALTRVTVQNARSLRKNVNELIVDAKKLFMLPAATLLEIVPKLVRDLARDQGKDVGLTIRGGNIEVDRRILDEMKDPLIHLVRNCIDHGIEKPEERTLNKKPEKGTIDITVSQIDGKIEILISDDGIGIDPTKVKQAAVTRKMMSQNEADNLSVQEALSLVFLSGVSTSPIVTDLSGRGIGLAVVQEKVQKLDGILMIENDAPLGLSIRILLPVILAGTRGVLIRIAEQLFIIPTAGVERVLGIMQDDIKTVKNRGTISLDGNIITLFRLGDILKIPPGEKKENSSDNIQVIVLSSDEQRTAFSVDEILHEQEVLVKNLGKQLSRVRNIAGATVLGSGRVVPILNTQDLIKSATTISTTPIQSTTVTCEAEMEIKTILVAEDSITSRTLLKNILEMAGYRVKTAFDGADAFAMLKTEDVDLVVSDIDMPRMNGFILTEKIRRESKLAELPVILVTGLESQEDRERGIDVGADAYILKSSFDQSNLLEAIQRLV